MKKILAVMLAAVMVIGMLGMTVFAREAAPSEAPVEGSWKLYQVCEVKDGQEPVLLKKDENQSLYGSGISILVFDKDGVGHNRIFEAGNLTDKDASWASPSENVYTFTEKDAAELTFNYAPSQDLLHRSFQDGERKLDFVYARAFVGTWKLDKVMEIHEGDAPTELSKDGNQSLYAESENLLTIKPDGTALCKEKDGGETTDVKGTWKKTDVDKIVWTEKDLDTVLRYFSVDDTLFRDVVNEAADAGHQHLRFVYARQADLAEKEESKEGGKEGSKEQETATTTAKSSDAAKPTKTGNQMNLYAEGGGDAITIFFMSDGTWRDDFGVVYTQEGGGGDHWYGSDGKTWVNEVYFENHKSETGKNFTGNTQIICSENDRNVKIQIDQLTDGRYVNQATGVFYTQEGGGGDHWYGDDGSVWVFEGYFEWLDEQNAKADVEQVEEPEEPVEVVEEVYEPANEEVYVAEEDGE